ncbi:MAG: metallophosphatase domain-containing protein [Saprospiraceae bacterium]|nr:metallophosphatase domain-containing protein [Saprospiraceae bacterium]
MKFITISDTHGQHQALNLPDGDVLIHAGDVSSRGTEYEVRSFLEWFAGLDFTYKIFIAGNHDFFFEQKDATTIKSLIPENVIYLNDSGVNIEGISIWGSPVSPWFYDWAFNRQRGADIKKHWDLIPDHTEILITHSPAFGILDRTTSGQHAGCEELKDKIEATKPKVHVCGHIHEAYGKKVTIDTLYINASVLNVHYQLVNDAIEFEL